MEQIHTLYNEIFSKAERKYRREVVMDINMFQQLIQHEYNSLLLISAL